MRISRGYHLVQTVLVLGVVTHMIPKIIYYHQNDDSSYSFPGLVNATMLSIVSCVMLRLTELTS